MLKTQLGPVISSARVGAFLAMLERATAAGAEGADRRRASRRSLKQGFLYRADCACYDVDPTFGDSVRTRCSGRSPSVMPFDDEADATAHRRTTPQFGLAASACGRRTSRARASRGEQARVRHGVGQRSPPARPGVAVGRFSSTAAWGARRVSNRSISSASRAPSRSIRAAQDRRLVCGRRSAEAPQSERPRKARKASCPCAACVSVAAGRARPPAP